jgi:hypothetical protein
MYAVYPIVWGCYRLSSQSVETNGNVKSVWQLLAVFLMALFVINTCYGWDGSFTRLGRYRFYSEALTGARPFDLDGDNRFIGTWAAKLPVPLPKYYVVGMDIQKRDFESGRWSYLRGEWRKGGWWYYYLYALAIKTPIGTLLLTVLAAILAIASAKYRADWCDEVFLLLPCIVIVGLVSSQKGINHHLRYVMPAVPFVFVFASRVARCIEYGHTYIMALVSLCAVGVVVSTALVYPHSLSYFNAFVGGPLRGHEHLGNSNADWGQDLLYLRKWLRDHPNVVLDGVALEPFFTLDIIGFPARQIPTHRDKAQPYRGKLSGNGPFPGWYAISVNQLHEHTEEFGYFLGYEPVDIVGYSIYIYHLTLDDANRVRRKVGVPELEEE